MGMSLSTQQKSTLSYFKWAFIVTVVGLILGGYLGWEMTGTVSGTASIFFICAVLAVLEISLSFDNAIVNANKAQRYDARVAASLFDLGHSHCRIWHAYRVPSAHRGCCGQCWSMDRDGDGGNAARAICANHA
jgi:hypothetical protein